MKRLQLATMVGAIVLALAVSTMVFASGGNGGRGIKGNGFRPMQKIELTDEQKAEMLEKETTKLDEILSSGKITQEQYDKAIAEIKEGRMPEELRGIGICRPEMTDEQKAEMLERETARLDEMLSEGKITQEQYDKAVAEIKEGRMPEELRGIGICRPKMTEEQKVEMLERETARLDEMLSAGKITQEQYDKAIAEIKEGRMPMPMMGRGERKGCRNKMGKMSAGF